MLKEKDLRKGLALSAVAVSLLLGGCSGAESRESQPEAPAPAVPPETTAARSARTAPAKSLDLAEPCVVVSQSQAQKLGADQVPKVRESNDKIGCDYLQGEAGGGFMVFVSADKSETMQKFADMRSSNVQMTEIGGYPTAQIGDDTNCLLSLDVSDHGHLFLNTLVSDGEGDPCGLSRQFAELALQNLPAV